MPLKSAFAQVLPPVDGLPPKLEPPASLAPAERELFVELVAAVDRRHFRTCDRLLLARYCEAAVLAEQAAKELREHGAVINGKASPWIVVQEKSVRTLTALSLRLRLSPQARLGNRAVARQPVPTVGRPWEQAERD